MESGHFIPINKIDIIHILTNKQLCTYKYNATLVVIVNVFWNLWGVSKPTIFEQVTSDEAFSLVGQRCDSYKF